MKQKKPSTLKKFKKSVQGSIKRKQAKIEAAIEEEIMEEVEVKEKPWEKTEPYYLIVYTTEQFGVGKYIYKEFKNKKRCEEKFKELKKIKIEKLVKELETPWYKRAFVQIDMLTIFPVKFRFDAIDKVKELGFKVGKSLLNDVIPEVS